MLDAKKMGHSIYSFARKKELFEKINSIVDNNNPSGEYISKKIKRMILSQNLTKLSLYLQNINEKEYLYILSNKQLFINSFEANKWSKGLKLFNYYV